MNSENDLKTVQLKITGKVQGVWFRASAKDAALSLGIKGKVWNNPDESVGAIAQGEQSSIEKFIEWCKLGPPLAKVQNVSTDKSESNEIFTTFEIVKHRPSNE